MQLIESFSASKNGDPDLCEDIVHLGADFIAILDGVTDRTYLDYNGMSGGRWAALAVSAVLDRLPAGSTLEEAEELITSTLAAGDRALQRDVAVQEAPAGAVMICYSRVRHELWRIGDCPFIIDGGVSNHGKLGFNDVMLATRWAYVSCLRQAGDSDEEIAADLTDPTAPLQRVQHFFSNADEDHPLAYGVLNGWPVPERLREIIPVAAEAREIVLGSDGYPLLLPTLRASEDYLAADLAADPLRIGRHRGFRAVTPASGLVSFDDRAYVRFTL